MQTKRMVIIGETTVEVNSQWCDATDMSSDSAGVRRGVRALMTSVSPCSRLQQLAMTDTMTDTYTSWWRNGSSTQSARRLYDIQLYQGRWHKLFPRTRREHKMRRLNCRTGHWRHELVQCLYVGRRVWIVVNYGKLNYSWPPLTLLCSFIFISIDYVRSNIYC